MKVCAKCNHENQPHYRFCLGCGADLGGSAPATSVPGAPVRPPDSERCSYCNLKVPPSAARCPNCNAPL